MVWKPMERKKRAKRLKRWREERKSEMAKFKGKSVRLNKPSRIRKGQTSYGRNLNVGGDFSSRVTDIRHTGPKGELSYEKYVQSDPNINPKATMSKNVKMHVTPNVTGDDFVSPQKMDKITKKHDTVDDGGFKFKVRNQNRSGYDEGE